MISAVAHMSLAAMQASAMAGEWECAPVGGAILASIRTQTGESQIIEATPEEFPLRKFSMNFRNGNVSISFVSGNIPVQGTVPLYRDGSYAAFTINIVRTEPKEGRPVSFWTNEFELLAAKKTRRFQVSNPLEIGMGETTTMSGAVVHFGDARLSAVALECRQVTTK